MSGKIIRIQDIQDFEGVSYAQAKRIKRAIMDALNLSNKLTLAHFARYYNITVEEAKTMLD